MRSRMSRLASLPHRWGLMLAFAAIILNRPAGAGGIEEFAVNRERLGANTVLVYRKTNIGFTEQMALITLYIDAEGNLHALKRFRGSEKPLLVEADFDWRIFSVAHFRAWPLPRGRAEPPNAVGDYDPITKLFHIAFHGGSKVIRVSGVPFHVHDFELMSLGQSMRQLKSLESSFTFDLIGMSDNPNEPIFYKDSGNVTVRYDRDTVCPQGSRVAEYTMVYSANGKYFGRLQLDRQTRDMVLAETPGPDEPDLISMRMQLVSHSSATADDWKRIVAGAADP